MHEKTSNVIFMVTTDFHLIHKKKRKKKGVYEFLFGKANITKPEVTVPDASSRGCSLIATQCGFVRIVVLVNVLPVTQKCRCEVKAWDNDGWSTALI